MVRNRLKHKINYTLPVLLPNKLNITKQGPATSGENIRSKRAIPSLAIIQGVAAIGRMMIKGINALVDVKIASLLYTSGPVSLKERLLYTLNKLFVKQVKSCLLLLDLDPFILQCSLHNIKYIKFTSPQDISI